MKYLFLFFLLTACGNRLYESAVERAKDICACNDGLSYVTNSMSAGCRNGLYIPDVFNSNNYCKE